MRVERDDVLLFVTNRTVEERFWLHPLLTCGLKPPNRRGRRAVQGLERHATKRYARLAVLANARRRRYAPKLTARDIERIAEGLVGSALARAQTNTEAEVFAFTAMSNHVHAVIRTVCLVLYRSGNTVTGDHQACTREEHRCQNEKAEIVP